MVWLVAKENILPGTWFLGWDSVVSELNFEESFKRALTGVWQEFQGVGLMGGHGYVTDLLHVSVLWVLNWFWPLNMLRYVFTFLMWWLGGIGMYFLSRSLVGNLVKGYTLRSLVSGLSSLVYMLHLAIIQNFYVQLDSFIWFYAWLPWAINGLFWVIRVPSKKRMLGWLGLNFVGSFTGFIPPVFVGYSVMVGLVLMGMIAFERKWSLVWVSLKVGLLMLLANAYWLLPLTYFTLMDSGVYLNSKLNRITTPENLVKSRVYGDLDDVVYGRGIYFESLDFSSDEEKAIPIMKPWMEQLEKREIRQIWSGVFVLGVVGLVTSMVGKRRKERKILALIALLTFGVMANNVSGFSLITEGIGKVPLLNQAFRIPFTKFSIIYVAFLAIMVAFGVIEIFKLVQKFTKSLATIVFVLMIMTTGVGIVWATLPIYEGDFLYYRSRINLPDEYFGVIEFFKQPQVQGRIAMFPVHSYNGWYINRLGYTGSGFLFYGLDQSVLDRSFDVWSKYNETFYKEVSRAVYNLDKNNLDRVLEKYRVGWILVDESMVDLSEGEKSLTVDQVKSFLSESGYVIDWQEGVLTVYKVPDKEDGRLVRVVNEINIAEADVNYISEDLVFLSTGEYMSRKDGGGVVYPFADVYRERMGEVEFENLSQQRQMKIRSNLPQAKGHILIPGLPKWSRISGNASIAFLGNQVEVKFDPFGVVYDGDEEVVKLELPETFLEVDKVLEEVLVSVGDEIVLVKQGSVKKVWGIDLEVGAKLEIGIFDYNEPLYLDLRNQFVNSEITKCWTRAEGLGEVDDSRQGELLRVEVTDASACVAMKIGEFSRTRGVMEVELPYRSINGGKPNFCITIEGDETYACQNEVVYEKSRSSQDWSAVDRRMLTRSGESYWIDVTARGSNTDGETVGLEYQTPKIAWYPSLAVYEIPGNVWNELETDVTIESKSEEIAVSFSGFENEIELIEDLQEEAFGCDLTKRGAYDKQINERGIEYFAQGGAAVCDYAILGEISNQKEYVVRVRGKAVYGKGLKFYMLNRINERIVVDEILSADEEEIVFPLLSWRGLDEGDYRLMFETRSFGDTQAKNLLTGVEIYNAPLSWLGKIRWIPLEENVPLNGDLRMWLMQKSGTSHYWVTFFGNEGVIENGQGFDKGWVGYEVDHLSWVNRFLPWVFGEKLEHVKVNGWANGWMIEPREQDEKAESGFGQLIDQAKAQGFGELIGNNGERKVVIVFWPQYLQWLGFLVLGGGFMVMTTVELRGFINKRLGNRRNRAN